MNVLDPAYLSSSLHSSVEHAEEEERKIRTDGIGHVSNFVKEVDVVGSLIHGLRVMLAYDLGLIFILNTSFLDSPFLATATTSLNTAVRCLDHCCLSSPSWPPLVLGVEPQFWLAD